MPDPAVRDAIREQYTDEVKSLATKLDAGDINLDQWQSGMKQSLRDSYALNLRAGADGPLKYTEYLKLGNPLQQQYRYLEQFKLDIASGAVSGGAIASRAALYVLSAVQMYWRQFTGGGLPAYPGDGSSECLSQCLCEWVDNGDGTWTWKRYADDSCPTCMERGDAWSPYVAD